MSEPSIEKRLQKRFILMTANSEVINVVNEICPDDWQMEVVTDLSTVGDWNDVLLCRFLLLDLDEVDAFDPLDVVRELRMQMQINIPVFCFGGDADIQEEMRLSRADRFFTLDALLAILPDFFEQYAW